MPRKALRRRKVQPQATRNTRLIGSEEEIAARTQKVQLTLFEAEKHPALEELETLDVTVLTPVEALMKLDERKRRIKKST